MSIDTVHDYSTPGCNQLEHCIIHQRDEPDEPHYRICGECRHVFLTAEELVLEESTHFGDHGRQVICDEQHPKGRIEPEMYSCPLCTHDF